MSSGISPIIIETDGGTEAMRVDPSGNVGIGTTSPNNQLVLATQASFGGNTSNTGSEPIEVQGLGAGVSFYDRTGGSTGRWVIYSDRTGGAGTETLRFWSAGDKVAITQGGNVGIGTTSPNNQLVLAAQASFGGNTSNTGSEPIEVQGSGAGVSFYDRTGGSTGRWVIYSDRTGGAGTETLRFWSAGDKVAITQGGNVGIGTTDPRTPLHVLGRISTGLDFTSAGAITFFPPDGFAWFHIDNGPAGGRGIGTMRFSYGANPGDNVVMSIDQTNNVIINGNVQVNGAKFFVQEHPTDPSNQIVYVSLEGGEAGTYTRGTWKLEDGKAVIELPEHFGMVTSEDGLSIQLTPRGEWLQLYVVQLTTREVVVQEAQGKSGQFDYLIQGVRKGYEHHEVIQRKK